LKVVGKSLSLQSKTGYFQPINTSNKVEIMKKLILTMLIVLAGMSVQAQDKKYGLGVNILYGTKIGNVGFGAKGQLYATEKLRVEANAAYFLKNNKFKDGDDEVGMKMWDVNAVAHYMIDVSQEKAFVYPIVGVGITNWVHSVFSAKTKFTVNLGAGFQYDVAEDFAINAEAKYQILSNYGQAVFGVGAVYKF